MAEIIIDKISNKRYLNHIIICDPSSASSYASSLLLREQYRNLDISTSEDNEDWRYYFIVRRHFLRKQKKDSKWICHYCDKDVYKMPERNKKRQDTKNCITVDHIVPVSECENKLNTLNFVECCYKCNQEKGTKTYEEFKTLKDGNNK